MFYGITLINELTTKTGIKAMELNFITTNSGKREWLSMEFKAFDIDINIKSPMVKIIEPQADSFEEVSISKARQAYDAVKAPVVVEDGGFSIPALSDFPGVYSKYINQTIGNEGLLKLVEGKDRNAYFITATSFFDGEILKTFTKKIYGTIPLVESPTNSKNAWSNLWKIFIPDGYTKTLSEMSEAELIAYQQNGAKKQSSLASFVKWFIDYQKMI